MAKKVQVLLVDDLDKTSPADESVTFALDGVNYEIDLTTENAQRLRDDLATWIGHAERKGGRRNTRSANTAKREDLSKIREWARANGHQVSERGRISAEIQDAYARANA